MAIRYIGSKERVADLILSYIGPPSSSRAVFVDAFTGTGAVALRAADRGWPVRLNDHLRSATVLASGRLVSREEASFQALGGYYAAVAHLNSVSPARGFIWRYYSPESAKHEGIERRYFTEQNAARIDGIRAEIDRLEKSGEVTACEANLLLADLLEATSTVANTAGTFGCYLSFWSANAKKRLELMPRELRDRRVAVQVLNTDVRSVPSAPDDVVYLDPPYTKRQYAAYYHILETIAYHDQPKVDGITGLRPWRPKASDFCYKTKALSAITSVVAASPARRVFLSYSSEGHVDLGLLSDSLESLGNVETIPLAKIGRYTPNFRAVEKGSVVGEFLVAIEKYGTCLRTAV